MFKFEKTGLPGLISISVTTPLVVMRGRIVSGLRISYSPKELYSGYSITAPPFVFYKLIKLSMYNGLKRLFNAEVDGRVNNLKITLCGALSGVGSAPFMAPFERIQMYQVVKKYSLSQAIKELNRVRGFRGFYTGFGCTILRDIIFNSLVLGQTYVLNQKIANKYSGKYSYLFLAISAASMGSLVGFITNPFDLIRTKQQSYNLCEMEPKNAIQVLNEYVNEFGILGLWKGQDCAYRVARISTGACVLILAMKLCQDWVKRREFS